MKTLNWRHTDWSARNFIFFIGQEIIGQLTFHNTWDFNAVYTDNDTRIRFKQRNFWDSKVSITRDEKIIGEIDAGLFKKLTIKLLTGEKYQLATNFWGRDVGWTNSDGERIINFKQATFSSMGKGTINLKDNLTLDTEKLLISSGLFVRQLIQKRVVLATAIMIPLLMISRR
ncbi:hypothetical protein [Limnoraphis robusta]|uniref:Uncharacterized protein n=1 Tax=Limnoraphis robusta CCNP1315 TaxID=3110306 RepID=A0ABU5U169_9CYAN|nr:hypothetical protein [Limnoraphis robusta]MEA5520810.1 hypothetical protein [Limnoraphis robusta CCNP1315]